MQSIGGIIASQWFHKLIQKYGAQASFIIITDYFYFVNLNQSSYIKPPNDHLLVVLATLNILL